MIYKSILALWLFDYQTRVLNDSSQRIRRYLTAASADLDFEASWEEKKRSR